MTFKGLLLKTLADLGIRKPDIEQNMNESDIGKNRLIWNLENGVFIFDVLDSNVNYYVQTPDGGVKIATLSNLDEATVLALKYLM